jgi:hydroxylaminobenzene mutase
VGLFLFSSLWGFVIPLVRARRLGLSVHTLSALEGIILIGLGLLWPRLELGTTSSLIAFWFFVYATLATLVPYVLAAVSGRWREPHSVAEPARFRSPPRPAWCRPRRC